MKKKVEFEFSRPLQVDRVAATGSHEKIEADAKEREAVAARLGLEGIRKLAAHLKATPWRGGLQVTGTVQTAVDQVSVVSLETFASDLSFSVERYYMPAKATVPEGEEDIDLIDHGEVDLGELVVEALALELDPYPRRPGEVFQSSEDVEKSEKASPFAALKNFPKD